jgi:hypothetical protein
LGETFVTSTWEVLLPSVAAFIGTFLNYVLYHSELLLGQAIILRQCYRWLKPKLRFSVRARDVDVH